MKRYGNIYPKIYDMENLKLAHKMASKDKSFYTEVQIVNSRLEERLVEIQEMLKNKTYEIKPTDYRMFEKNDKGKIRKIYKLSYFPHRIIQWAMILQIQQYFMSNFIDDTFASLPKRGIHKALLRLDKALKEDEENTQFCLKMDIRKFYPSINHEINKAQYRRKFKDPDLLALIDQMIDSLCLDREGGLSTIPQTAEERHGIAIGSLFSQFNGNFYLSAMSHWMKEQLKIKYLFIYCDDIVVLGKTKAQLHTIRTAVSEYLQTNLKLELKNNYQIFNAEERGIDFVGYRHFRKYILLRKTTSKRLIRKMRKITKKINKGGSLTFSEWCSINSYLGWMMWANCYNLYKKWIAHLEPYCRQYYDKHIARQYKYHKKKGGYIWPIQ